MQTLNKSRHNIPPIGQLVKLYNLDIPIDDIATQIKLPVTTVKYYIKNYPIIFKT
jgi:hypothetical protein